MNRPRFHHVPGLTLQEYRTLRDELRQPRLYWPPLNRTDLRTALSSALWHMNLFLKAEQCVKALTLGIRAMTSPDARAVATKYFARLEARDLYLMRDLPSKDPKVWSKNKARLAYQMDMELCRICNREFPSDFKLAGKCKACMDRWLRKRLPGLAKRLKPGPKTGRRRRLRKRKENGNAKHN